MTDTIDWIRTWYPVRLLCSVVLPFVVCWAFVVALAPVDRSAALYALVVFVVPVGFVALCTSESTARKWALDRGARLDPPVVEQLARHLCRTRVARTVGVVLSFAASSLAMDYSAGSGPSSPDTWGRLLAGYWLPGVGYVVGSLWAELTKPRDRTGSVPGTAVLTPRRVNDFLDRGVLRVWLVTIMIALASIVLWASAPEPAEPGLQRGYESAQLVGTLAVSLLATCAVWFVCRRRERAADDQALAYEELTRTATANALAGTAIAFLGWYSSELLGSLRVQELTPWMQLPAVLLGLLSLAVWAGCGTKFVFRSRRIDAFRVAA